MSDALQAALDFARETGRDEPQLWVRLTLWTGTILEGALNIGTAERETVMLRPDLAAPSRIWITRSGIVAVELLAAPPAQPARAAGQRPQMLKDIAHRFRGLLRRAEPRS